MLQKRMTVSACALMWSFSANAATYDPGLLQFMTTAPQNAWGTGNAAQVSGGSTISQTFDTGTSIGAMGTSTIPNPVYVAEKAVYDTANLAYQGLLTTHNNVTVPAYNTAKQAYDSAWSTYNTAVRTYNTAIDFYNTVTYPPYRAAKNTWDECRKYSPYCGPKPSRPPAPRAPSQPTLPFPTLAAPPTPPTPPTSPQTIQARNGAEGSINIDGEVGIKFDYLASAGSVDPTLNFSASAVIPDTVLPGTYFNLGSSTSTLVSGAINAVSPGINASVSGILDVKIDAGGEVCALNACTQGSGTLIDINETIELLSVDNTEVVFIDGIIGAIDPTGTAKLSFPVANATTQLYKGQPLPKQWPVFVSENGINVAPGFPSLTPQPPYVELAKGTVGFPNFDFSTGTIQNNMISASGSGQVIDVKFDLDGITNLINPTLPPGGASVSFGPPALNAAVTLDALDAKAGPTVDLIQEFDILAALDVTLDFDRPVYQLQTTTTQQQFCFGSNCFTVSIPLTKEVLVSSIKTTWNALPDIRLLDTTTVTPTFSVNATMMSRLAAQLGLELDVTFGSGSFNMGPLTAAFGPLLDLDIPSYTPSFGNFDLFSDQFALTGFNSIVGNAFTIDVLKPTTTSTTAPVPVPPALAMSASALAILVLRRRRRRPA